MSFDVKQSSTQAPLPFLLVQSSDHITGLTGASPTVTISKAGGSFASPSGSVTEIANGWYKVAGNATDTGTLGPILLHATAASGDPCDIQVANVVAYDPQDAVRAGLTALPNAAANAAGGLPVSAAGSLDLDEMNADVEAIQVQTDKLTFTVANQIDANVIDWKGAAAPAMTGDAFARLGAPAGASVSADIAAAKVDTAAIKVQTDKLAFTVANQVDSNVIDWKGATAPAMTGDAFARLGAPAGASVSADVAAVKVDTAAVKVQTDKLTFTVANQVDSNVLDWKSSTAPAMTGDAFARLGAPAGASVSVDIAALKSDLDGGVTVTSAGRNAIADSLLARNMKGGTSTGRSVYQAFATLRNKSAIVAGLLTVYDEDDSTALFEANITTAAGDPISAIAPTT